jgi:N-acetylglucosaminyldiphosphoundecaprenol N-acetyl-beta-D-mannosaminyltransferase
MTYERRTVPFLDLQFDVIDQAGVVARVEYLARQDQFSYVVTPNVDHIVRLQHDRSDQRLWQSYRKASILVCDSRILQRLARLSGVTLELVTGSDLTARLIATGPIADRIAVIGGSEELLVDLRTLYPAVDWEHHQPPQGVRYNPAAQLEIIDFVEKTPARVILFAIGSPQSELLCSQIATRDLAKGVSLCIGASLEFLTGAKSRAPKLMQHAGLEWLFRLSTEPRRLWKRYLVEGPRILTVWLRWHLKSR